MNTTIQFSLDTKQTASYYEWLAEHKKQCKRKAGAIGGADTFSFIPTGLGTLVEVSCICGDKINLTDTDGW